MLILQRRDFVLMGLLILFTSISIGLLCAYLEIKRSHCMGVLLLPSILFFAEINPLVISVKTKINKNGQERIKIMMGM